MEVVIKSTPMTGCRILHVVRCELGQCSREQTSVPPPPPACEREIVALYLRKASRALNSTCSQHLANDGRRCRQNQETAEIDNTGFNKATAKAPQTTAESRRRLPAHGGGQKALFQDKPREGTHNLWQISRQGKGSRFKVETPQKTSRGSKQPPHKKPKHPPAAASELTEKMEQQLRRMVNQMSGEEPPPYIRSGTCSSKSLTRKRT